MKQQASRINFSLFPLNESKFAYFVNRQRTTISIPSEWTSYQLKELRPDTIYSITVTSVTRNRRTKSSPVHLAVPPLIESGRIGHSAIYNSNIYLTPLPNATVAGSINVRGEEVGIVVLVLAG